MKKIIIISLVILILVFLYFYTKPNLKFYKKGKKIDKKLEVNKISDLENITAIVTENSDSSLVITKDGGVYRFKSPKDYEQILNLNIADETFYDRSSETGLLGVVKINNKIYLSYTVTPLTFENDVEIQLIINEYSENMKFIREIDRIDFYSKIHHSGTLQKDSNNNLLIATGDSGPQGDPDNHAQNLNNKLGKILRYNLDDLSSEIIAYGLRNPWKFSVENLDGEEYLMIADVGWSTSESVYKIKLNQSKPANLGWNIYEGSVKLKDSKQKVIMPVFEYPTGTSGRSVTGGFIVEKYYLLTDYVTGTVRLLDLENFNEVFEKKTGLNMMCLGMMKNDQGSYGVVAGTPDGLYWLNFS